MEKLDWTIDSAREYLQIVKNHFEDTNFYNYIDKKLAGDYAVELARLIYENTDIRTSVKEPKIVNDWKELVIYNLPEDIMTGNYEVEVLMGDTWEKDLNWEEDQRGVALDLLKTGRYRNRYRGISPLHEEILNNWFYDKNTRVWCRVIGYRNGVYSIYHHKHMQNENYNTISKKTADWFIGKKSAKTPPGVTE